MDAGSGPTASAALEPQRSQSLALLPMPGLMLETLHSFHVVSHSHWAPVSRTTALRGLTSSREYRT